MAGNATLKKTWKELFLQIRYFETVLWMNGAINTQDTVKAQKWQFFLFNVSVDLFVFKKLAIKFWIGLQLSCDLLEQHKKSLA